MVLYWQSYTLTGETVEKVVLLDCQRYGGVHGFWCGVPYRECPGTHAPFPTCLVGADSRWSYLWALTRL
jgi:hypothetical protein